MLLFLVGDYAGEPRLALPGNNRVTARAVDLVPGDPRRRWVGALEYLGGVHLAESGGGIGGYSAIAVDGDRFTLVSDGGTVLTFRWSGPGSAIRDARWRPLPAGPGRGWSKIDRDSESLAIDRAGDSAWIGFEGANQIWRYDAGLTRATGRVAPVAMSDWPDNGGPETLAQMPDRDFIVISERRRGKGARGRSAILFPGDPVGQAVAGQRFTYMPPDGMDPVDAAALPDGRLLVLNRRFSLPYRFSVTLTLIDAGAIRSDAVVRGRTVATLDRPTIHDNFEGVAVTREHGRTIVWLVSDNNQSSLQRTLLLKFALAE